MLTYCCSGALFAAAITFLGAFIVSKLPSDNHPKALTSQDLTTCVITFILPIMVIVGTAIGGIVYTIQFRPRILGEEWDQRILFMVAGFVLAAIGFYAESKYDAQKVKQEERSEGVACLSLLGILLLVVSCISSVLLAIRGY